MSNSNIIVIMTTAKTKPGKEKNVHQALRDVATAARAEPGCMDYRIFRSAEDSAITINFERWASEEARDAFLAGPEVKKFAAAVSGAFAGSPQPVSFHEIG